VSIEALIGWNAVDVVVQIARTWQTMWSNHRAIQIDERGQAVAGIALVFLTVGTAAIGGVLAIATANADDCTVEHPNLSLPIFQTPVFSTLHANNQSVLDCGAGESGSVDGHSGNVATAGVEDYDGTQGEMCGATAPFSVPRC